MKIRRYIPILEWLPKYRSRHLRGDLSAGLTVGIILIPQGLAYAMLAGLPPIYGLYASLLPLVLYAIFGTSRQLSVGPMAMISLMVLAGVGQLAEPGTETYIGLAILLSLMSGVLQLLLGVFRLGFLVNFLSGPVISGFTSAAAIIIGLSQLKHLLGIDLPRSEQVHEVFIAAGRNISQVHIPTLILGSAGIAVIMLFKRFLKKVPGALVAVILSIIAVAAFGLADSGIQIVGQVPAGLPKASLPPLDLDSIRSLIPAAITISLVGFMQSIAIAKFMQAKHKDYEVDANQELIALGVSNIGGAFFKAFPTTGGLSRTAVNDDAGAQTGVSSIISAGFIVLTLLFLTPVFYNLPQAILASVIMASVFGLIDWKAALLLAKTDLVDFALLMATFLATLLFGIEMGIVVGVALSLVMVIYRSAYPHVAELGRLGNSMHYRNVERFPEVEQRPDVLIIRFDAQLYFANVGFLRDKMDQLMRKKGKDLRLVVLNAESISFIDSSAIQVLRDMVTELRAQNIRLVLAGVIGPVRDILFRSGLAELLGEDALFVHCSEAVDFYDDSMLAPEHRRAPHAQAARQTNVGKSKKPNP